LTLAAGDYRIDYSSAYTSGYSYNQVYVANGSDTYQQASASAYLYNIQPIVEPAIETVPEPASLVVWSMLATTLTGASWLRRHKPDA
jgi:hypothetical protein